MTIQWRPLGYSLLLHLFVVLTVALLLFKHTQQAPKHEIKMQIKLTPGPTAATATPAIPKKTPQEVVAKPIHSTPINTSPHIQTAPLPFVPQPKPIAATVTVPKLAPATEIQTSPATAPKSSVAITPTPAVNIEKEFLDAHLGEIRALLIKNLRYPRNAQRLRMQGEVRVGFRLKSDGSVENIEVIQSSGFELLDEDARTLIKNTASQFPKPTKNISLSIPLSYLLR